MNVIPIKRKARAERQLPLAHTLVHHPLALQRADENLLGMLDHYDGHVVVRAFTAEKEWRKVRGRQELVRKARRYTVDTPIEGVRLLLRVNGLHHATVQQGPDGFRVHVPPVPAGDEP